MKGQTSKALRIVLLIYAIYFALYGLLHMLFPNFWGPKDPATTVLIGAAILALVGFGTLLAYLEKAWDRVKIVVLVQVVWIILYTITFVWGILTGGIPAEGWPIAIIGAVFAVLLAILYSREERIQKH